MTVSLVSVRRALRIVALGICSDLRYCYEYSCAKGHAVLEEIGESTGILAIKLVCNRSLHLLERLLWLSVILFGILTAYNLSSTQIQRYNDSPTVVSLDRDYRDWSGTMPAVTLCYNDNLDAHKANDYIESKWNISIADQDYSYFMQFLYAVVNATASNYVDLARFAEDERFEDVDLIEVINAVYRPYSQVLMSFDSWFKISVNPVMTERGRCYVINSPISAALTTANDGNEDYEDGNEALVCEYGKQQCYIKMDIFQSTGTKASELRTHVKLYVLPNVGSVILVDVHSAHEISDGDENIVILRKSNEVVASYKVTETVASEKLRELNPKQRKCVFRDEETSQLPIYTKTMCLARCRAVMALEMCNCVPFFYPNVEGPSCSPAGFECLLDFKWPVWALHICNCPNTCTEAQYTLQSIKRRSWGGKDTNKAGVTATFRWEVSPPKARMRRDVLFSFEDLLVSFGGTLALFLGSSFMSFAQIANVLIYNAIGVVWIIIRMICRWCWNAFQKLIDQCKAKKRVNAFPKAIRKAAKTEVRKPSILPDSLRN